MCFKDVSSTFESTSRLLCFFLKFIVACHSSQLPKQKEGLFNLKKAIGIGEKISNFHML